MGKATNNETKTNLMIHAKIFLTHNYFGSFKEWLKKKKLSFAFQTHVGVMCFYISFLYLMQQNPQSLFLFFQTEQFTVLWVLFATIVLGNSAVLITLYLNKRKSRMNFFIKQLAFAGKYLYWKTFSLATCSCVATLQTDFFLNKSDEQWIFLIF